MCTCMRMCASICICVSVCLLLPLVFIMFLLVMLICIVIFSMFCTAKWLDAEKIIKLEYLKSAMIFVCLCYLYSFSPGIFLINVLFFYLLLIIAFLPFLDRE